MPLLAQKTWSKLLLLIGIFVLAGLVLVLEKPSGALKGRILDKQGQPLAGAKITIDAYPLNLKSFTDSQGYYEISQIPVGKYYIGVHQKGFQRAYLNQHLIQEGKTLNLGITSLEPLKPNLYISLWNTTKLPGEKVALSMTGAKVRQVQFQIFQVDLVKYLEAGGKFNQLDQSKSDPSQWSGLKKIKDWEYQIPEQEVPEFDLKVKVPVPDLPGLYLIHGAAASLDRKKVFTSNTLLNKTDLGFITKRDAGRVLVFVSSLEKPQPLSGVEIRLFAKPGPAQVQSSQSDGLVSFPLGDLSKKQRERLFLVAQHGSSTAFTYAPDVSFREEYGEGYPVGKSPLKGLFAMIYTDRPLYRPGQEVHLKGIARRRNARGTYDLPPSGSVDLLVEDPRGNVLQELKMETNAMGSFNGTVTLPGEADLGYYNLRATLHGMEFRESFEVDEYRKPEFKVDITPEKESYFAGDQITFLLDAQYYFGAPVEAQVEYSLYKSSYYYVPPGDGLLPDYMDVYGGDGYVGGYGEYIKDGKLSTDAKGRGRVSYQTKESTQDHRYTLRVRATDISGRMIEREGDAIVTAGDFFFRTRRTQFLATPKQAFPLEVLTRNYQDQPVSLDFKIKLERQSWDPIARRFRYKKESVLRGKTDAKGSTTSEIITQRGGYYRLVLSGKDSAGRKVEYRDYLWVSGMGADSEDFALQKEVRVIADKKKYQAGETAKVFIVGPERNGKVLVSIEGSKLYRDFVITLDGFSKEIELPLEQDWIPNIFLNVSAIGKKEFYSGEVRLLLSAQEHFLTVDIQPSSEKLEPGQKITYEVTTRDKKGKGVPAELSLGVVDEKIYALRAERTNIRNFFWGPRPNRVGMNYSFSGYYSGGIEKEDRNLLRRNFKDTAYWAPTLVTDEQGKARVSFDLPDNLTTWRATVLASTATTSVGQQINKVISSKPLIARIAAPRFFRERDQVVLKAILHNYTEQEQEVQVDLGLSGLKFLEPKDDQTRTLTLPPKEVVSFDFGVLAQVPGEGKVQLLAKNSQLNDGVELAIPVLPHGVADQTFAQGRIPPATDWEPSMAKISLDLPPQTDALRSGLQVSLDTNFVAQLLGSLNYLVQYPYGCVEQTMSRLLPAMMVSRLYQSLGLQNPQLEKKLPSVIRRGLRKIDRMQNPSGGWGWWAGESTNPFMTAYALYGLIRAQQMGEEVEARVLTDGLKALQKIIKKGLDPNAYYLLGKKGTEYFIHYVAALGRIKTNPPLPSSPASLEPMAQALLILTLEQQGRGTQAESYLRELVRSAQCQKDQCHYVAGNKYHRRDVMATAWALQALIAGKSTDETLKDSLARWLLAQRKGGRWSHTLETATVLYSLATYAQDLTMAAEGVRALLFLDKKSIDDINLASPHYEKTFPGCIPGTPLCQEKNRIPLRVGKNVLTISNIVLESLYYSTVFTYFSTEEDLAASEDGIRVRREYFLLTPHREPGKTKRTFKISQLKGKAKKGEMVGVRITLESDQNLHYLILEDPLPSGFEVVEDVRFDKKVAYSTQKSVRDEKIVFFRSRLKKGTHVFNYALMPELLGDFHVMPTEAEEMYRPEVRGSGAEARLVVEP